MGTEGHVTVELFDHSAGAEAARDGIERAQYGLLPWNIGLLEEAQCTAIAIAKQKGEVTADDVVAAFNQVGVDLPGTIGNAMGSLFRGRHWRHAGTKSSTRITNHARLMRVWRWEE